MKSLGYSIPQVDEYIRLMRDKDMAVPEEAKRFHELYHFVRGMLTMAKSTSYTDLSSVESSYYGLSYTVANKLGFGAYFAILHKAQEIDGALESYPNDLLDIDADCIYRHPQAPFLFVLRDMGTHLYFVHDAEHEDHAMRGMKSTLETFNGIFYIGFWDGERLHDLDKETWKQEYEAIFPGHERED